MSPAPTDFETLLRGAVEQARANAPQALEDLIRLSSQATNAVAAVTAGGGILELIPVAPTDGKARIYQLQFRRRGSDAPPADMGVFQVTDTGYPILRWWSRRNWEDRPDRHDRECLTPSELESVFSWLLSHPTSKLVVLVTFLQQRAVS